MDPGDRIRETPALPFSFKKGRKKKKGGVV